MARTQPLESNPLVSDEWTIVAGGPSIAVLDLEASKVGLVVCVNRAFYRFPEHADVWAAMDHPVTMWKTSPDPKGKGDDNMAATAALLDEHRPMVWGRACHKALWDEIGADFRSWNLRLGGGPKPKLIRVPWSSSSTVDWSQGTTMIALGLLMRQRPKRVRILGCDQEGIGGWNGTPSCWPPRHRTQAYQGREWWERRWTRERKALSSAIDEAKEHGIVIEHVKADVVS